MQGLQYLDCRFVWLISAQRDRNDRFRSLARSSDLQLQLEILRAHPRRLAVDALICGFVVGKFAVEIVTANRETLIGC